MSQEKESRRDFMASLAARFATWAPIMGLFGFRFCRYSMGPVGPWAGWIEWCGRAVGFVAKDGKILWLSKLVK